MKLPVGGMGYSPSPLKRARPLNREVGVSTGRRGADFSNLI